MDRGDLTGPGGSWDTGSVTTEGVHTPDARRCPARDFQTALAPAPARCCLPCRLLRQQGFACLVRLWVPSPRYPPGPPGKCSDTAC